MHGEKSPPKIDIKNIQNIPIALIIGNNDELATVEDNKWLINNLDSSSLKMIKYLDGGHLSFMLGKEADYLEDVIRFV